MKNKVERSAYLIIDGEAKSVAATEKLLTDQGQVYLAMIFENESYLIVDQTGKPVEYCPTEDTYVDAIGRSTKHICSIVGWGYPQNVSLLIKNGAHLRAIFAELMQQLFYLLIIKTFAMSYHFLKRFEKKDHR